MKDTFLDNAPLKEVLFELQWEVDFLPEQGIRNDSGFEQAVLRFTQACQQDFKDVVLLKPENIPPAAFIHRVTHRFFKIQGQHPLYQMGPGVFTVNDNNRNYSWADFEPLILNGLTCLRASYKKELIPAKVQLRYIDRVSPFIFDDSNKFEFLREHLQVNAESYPFIEGELQDIQFIKRFLIDENSFINLLISTSVDKETKEEVIEWHTFVSNNKRLTWEELGAWIANAHVICSKTFKSMISKQLYEYFSK